jgi:23S rRNA (guanosine2251-2'-O)-methyltransferase
MQDQKPNQWQIGAIATRVGVNLPADPAPGKWMRDGQRTSMKRSRRSPPGDPPASRPAQKGDTEVVVYGRRSVLEALAAPRVEVSEVRVARSLPGPYSSELAQSCRRQGVELQSATYAEVRALSGEPRHDQGVVARVRLLGITSIEAYVASLTGPAARHPAQLLALDGITNPQNIGMIVRSVLASQIGAMLWPLSGSPWINGLIVKASASSIFRCPIIRCDTLAEGLYALKAAGFEIVGLARDSEEELFSFRPPHRSAYVVGSETVGVSAEIAALTDRWLSIAIHDEVESLNVAVAASLVCFHGRRSL